MGAAHQFPTTQWSLILSIQDKPSGRLDREGVEKFCRDYWPPVASFLRSVGLSHEDAEDIAQEVFSQLHAGEKFPEMSPTRGRMRSFLMTIAKRQAVGFFRKQQTQKRGGGQIHVPIEIDGFEHPGVSDTEQAFDRSWALQLIDLTTQELRLHYERRNRLHWFAALFPKIASPQESGSYQDVALKLNTSEGSVRSGIHRMKQKYQKILRDEVAKTVASPEEIDSELLALFDALGHQS
ncbi:RNA polymerase sigma factor [Verrucomicrobiaceae bacterium 227]